MEAWKLRDYQQEAKEKVDEALAATGKALMVMATGLGKTIVGGFCVKDLVKEGRCLFLCHTTDILQQTMEVFSSILGPSVSMAPFYGQEKGNENADVVFSLFQTLKNWINYFPQDHFSSMIVDESHHGQAPTYHEVIRAFHVKKLLGMTATPDREDEKDIREIFGPEIVQCTLEEGIANGWLTPVTYKLMQEDINARELRELIKKLRGGGKRLTRRVLNHTVFIRRRDEEIARLIIEYNKKAIIFCQNILHAETFAQHLPSAHPYHVQRKKEENEQHLREFKEGKVRYLLAVDKLNEGVDIPDAELIVFLRSTVSKTIFLQQLGRGLRLSPGKTEVTVLDFVRNCKNLERIYEIARCIARIHDPEVIKSLNHTGGINREHIQFTGFGFNFEFTEVYVEVLKLLQRIKRDFYPTWQEAGRAAGKLACWTKEDYQTAYWKDPKLPSSPSTYYADFPGWPAFLMPDVPTISYYPSWQEAAQGARNLGIKNKWDYADRYHNDRRLPSTPASFYHSFPGWPAFLGREDKRGKNAKRQSYPTWQTAAKAAKKLGIKTTTEYKTQYAQDPLLPASLEKAYSDYPGWKVFITYED